MIRRTFLKALAALLPATFIRASGEAPGLPVIKFVNGEMANAREILGEIPFDVADQDLDGIWWRRCTPVWVNKEDAVLNHYGEMKLVQRVISDDFSARSFFLLHQTPRSLRGNSGVLLISGAEAQDIVRKLKEA